MRIAFLTPEYVKPGNLDGGLANYIKKTAALLSERGWEVTVFVLSDREAAWKDGSVEILEIKRGSPTLRAFSRVPFSKRIIMTIDLLISLRSISGRFWEEHGKKPFDIIQASSYMAPGYFLLKNRKVPVVCRISSYSPVVRAAYGRTAGLYDRLNDRLELRQALDADASFAPSKLIASMFLKTGAPRPEVITTPVDTQTLTMDYSYFNAHKGENPYLLFFGTLSRIKGSDLLADVLPAIFEEYNNLNFISIGRDDGLPGGEKVSSYILSKCMKYKSRLHFYPALQKPQLYPFIANAEMMLMPSRIDNYPNACLEVQAFGKPVIGTYGSSLDEMIEDGATGFLADANAVSIRAAIEKCLNMTSEEKEAMRRRILSHMDGIRQEDRVGQLINFYQNTIRGFKNRP